MLTADVLVAAGASAARALGVRGDRTLGAAVEQPRMSALHGRRPDTGRDRYVATAMGDGQRAGLAAAAFLGWFRGRSHR